MNTYEKVMVVIFMVVAIAFGVYTWKAQVSCAEAGGTLVRGPFLWECVQEVK